MNNIRSTRSLPLGGDYLYFRFVEGGKFTLGATRSKEAPAYLNELPPREVEVKSFWLSETVVTQSQWQTIFPKWSAYHQEQDDNYNLPMENISYADVQEYIAVLMRTFGTLFRLPTEAEWEYAAKGGNRSKGYLYSGCRDIGFMHGARFHASGTGRADAFIPNELGLFGMSGNVWEMTSDIYKPSGCPMEAPASIYEANDYIVIKGGSYDSEKEECRVTSRQSMAIYQKDPEVGFRLAFTA